MNEIREPMQKRSKEGDFMRKTGLTVILGLIFIFLGCAEELSDNAVDLMRGIRGGGIPTLHKDGVEDAGATTRVEITEFSLNLFRECFKGEKSTLLSPISIISALGMVANGANDETLSQMEGFFTTDIQSLNGYLKGYLDALPNGNKYRVNLANSIWFKDEESLTVNKGFLQTNKCYYDSSIYKVPFDGTTKDDINNWVKYNTDGQIKGILTEPLPRLTVMCLINVLSFDAEWDEVYEDYSIYEELFTLENGEVMEAEFMYSNENLYLEIEGATGFIKPYKNDKYAFVALLPDEDIKLADFVDSLDGEEVATLLEKPEETLVSASIPKFSSEYFIPLNKTLKNLGMTDAFDAGAADFSGLGKSTIGNIYISEVKHQAKIDVGAKGTKASAVTFLETACTSIESIPKVVRLDRPFFYMVIDREENLPLFMGTLMVM